MPIAAVTSGAQSSRHGGRSCACSMSALLVLLRMKTAGNGLLDHGFSVQRLLSSVTIPFEAGLQAFNIKHRRRYFDGQVGQETRSKYKADSAP